MSPHWITHSTRHAQVSTIQLDHTFRVDHVTLAPHCPPPPLPVLHAPSAPRSPRSLRVGHAHAPGDPTSTQSRLAPRLRREAGLESRRLAGVMALVGQNPDASILSGVAAGPRHVTAAAAGAAGEPPRVLLATPRLWRCQQRPLAAPTVPPPAAPPHHCRRLRSPSPPPPWLRRRLPPGCRAGSPRPCRAPWCPRHLTPPRFPLLCSSPAHSHGTRSTTETPARGRGATAPVEDPEHASVH